MDACAIYIVEWPAIAKLGLDIASNAFLSVAFLMVIYRHYRLFGNSLHKSLMASGIIFSYVFVSSYCRKSNECIYAEWVSLRQTLSLGS